MEVKLTWWLGTVGRYEPAVLLPQRGRVGLDAIGLHVGGELLRDLSQSLTGLRERERREEKKGRGEQRRGEERIGGRGRDGRDKRKGNEEERRGEERRREWDEFNPTQT